MPKREIEIPLPGLVIDRTITAPLYQQLYDGLRDMILDGVLRPGQRLPSTRVLSREFGVSRNTILQAYDALHAEGYVDGQTGSGTHVSENLPDAISRPVARPAKRPREASGSRRILSRRGAHIARDIYSAESLGSVRALEHGVPALDAFPRAVWTRLVSDAIADQYLGYSHPAGYLPLREAIAEYVRASRAVVCEPEQIVIVNGSQQALDVAARILLDEGDDAWVEDPGYRGARLALGGAGANLIPVPVDRDGIRVDRGVAMSPDARVAYVNPSHQYPTGATMSLPRRFELLEWASRTGAWILEDDYDSEYRYTGRPLASLQGLDYDARVIYIGTFSKVLVPALRLGYVIAPSELVAPITSARLLTDVSSSIVEQSALARFFTEGHFGRHVRRMRVLYRDRQSSLLRALDEHLPALEAGPTNIGLHTVLWLPDGVDDVPVSRALAARGILAAAVSSYATNKPERRGLVLGYAAFPDDVIRATVATIAEVVRDFI